MPGGLAVLLLATIGLTQVINHVAAAVIMTPVALSLAAQLGVSDRPFLMAVITGAEFAFFITGRYHRITLHHPDQLQVFIGAVK